MTEMYTDFVQKLILPIYDVVKGTSRFKYKRILEKTQWLPRKKIEQLQVKNLRVLLKHAYDTVPYYHRIFKEKSLLPNNIKNVEDLTKLPILYKEDIRKNFDNLFSKEFPRHKLIPGVSGGTGDQINFYMTKEQQSWELASEARAYNWAGYELGDKCIMFWGSPIDLRKNTKVIKTFTNYLERILVLNTYVLSNDILNKYAKIMYKFNPNIIRGYATSVYLMAKYILKNGINYVRPKTVITSAETLFDYQRKVIEEAFGCPVFDYYGSREVGSMAAQCEEHLGYHISAENVVLEFVREGEHVAEGEDGVIIVTNLRNYGMPFIRYAIGDVGKPSEELCNCGRSLPLINSIEGRTSQFMAVFDNQAGRVIPVSTAAPGVFSSLLMHLPIERYRIIQESLNRIIIRAVRGKGYTQKHTDFLIDHLQNYLGTNISIEFEFVNYLPPLPSGKRTVFISKINPFEQYMNF